ncbi:MAG: T9SS type A sorting domain-containing protein [Bacteroidetes bacterium]|nr:MAG: T9SS type A sorting domain-containing protein [Bacteroidota bacterium]
MKKLVLILFFVIIQTSFAQWELCNNGLQGNEISYSNVEGNITYTDKTGGEIITTDNGDYWFTKNIRISNLRVLSLAMNGNNIFTGTEYEQVFLSSNNGVEWKYMGLKNSTAIAFMIIIGNNIFLGGQGVYLSTDNGNNWTEKNSGLIYLCEPSLIINGDYIYAGTNNGRVFRAKLSDLGITDVKDTYRRTEYTIYPNPSSDFILIKSDDEAINQKIKINDILGNTVWQGIMNGESMRIDISTFPGGVYYVYVNGITKMFVKN